MTTPTDAQGMREQVREVIRLARIAVTAMEQLPEQASDETAREWADNLARSARESWQALTRVVREAHGGNFLGLVRSITSLSTPLYDRPESMAAEAEAVRVSLNSLARAYLTLTQPWVIAGTASYDDALFSTLAAALRSAGSGAGPT